MPAPRDAAHAGTTDTAPCSPILRKTGENPPTCGSLISPGNAATLRKRSGRTTPMRTKYLAGVLCAMSAMWLMPMACQAATILASSGPGSEPLIHRCVKYLGKFHLLALHFPIALLLAA